MLRRLAGSVCQPAATEGAASGYYFAYYFFGGLVGTAVLGRLFDAYCWAGIGIPRTDMIAAFFSVSL